MVIRHSLQILEQLSEIEELIQKVEALADSKGLQFDREMLIQKIMMKQQSEQRDS